MRRFKVLIVDDAVAVRRLVSEALGSDPAIEVAGTAASGSIALAKIDQLAPDVVTLDVEMPEMDGLQTLAAIRRSRPDLPVIMFSTLTRRGAEATLQALTLGASDYVAKPAGSTSPAAAMQRVREELVPRIRALCSKAVPRAAAAPPPPPPARAARHPVDVLVLGCSTGGPNALASLLPALPGRLSVPVLVVQHMPAVFTELLASRLAQQCALRVAEARSGQVLLPGHAWICPGDFHMTLERRGGRVEIGLNREPPENSCRPSVDVLFRSAAWTYGRGVLAVVLTGMGQDGLRGCEKVREAGGLILAQDEATSVVWGMPGLVARAGLAEAVVPLPLLAWEIVRRVDEAGAGRDAGAAAPRAGALEIGGA